MNLKKEIIPQEKFLSKTINRIFILYTLLISLIITIAYNGSIPHIVGYIPLYDKIGHFFLVGFLSYLLDKVLNNKKSEVFKIAVPLGPLLVFSFFTIDEFFQLMSSVRTFDFFDLLSNAFGIIIFYKYKNKLP